MKKLLMLLLASLIAPVTLAGPIFRVLVPIYIQTPVPGAHGSLWVSDFTAFNASATPHSIKWCSPTETRPCILSGAADEELLPGETQRGLPARYEKPSGANPGAILYIEAHGEVAGPIAMQLRVKDESRNAQSAGTEVAVVRESSLRTAAVQLLDLASDERFRALLRIYDVNRDAAAFRVTLINEETGGTIRQETLQATTSRAQEGLYRFQPAYAQWPEITSNVPPGTRIRVEIEPLTPGSLFWAFISVTNNVTQEFTLITPQ
jgi:hypothetical protein